MTETHPRSGDHQPMAGEADAFSHWPPGLQRELEAGYDNGCVGSVLVSETERVRVWHLTLQPGERCGFHRHVNPYFWTALTPGRARNYSATGAITETTYSKGETRHFHYGPGEYMLHALENIGDGPLSFTTVEFMDGINPPLPVPDEFRL